MSGVASLLPSSENGTLFRIVDRPRHGTLVSSSIGCRGAQGALPTCGKDSGAERVQRNISPLAVYRSAHSSTLQAARPRPDRLPLHALRSSSDSSDVPPGQRPEEAMEERADTPHIVISHVTKRYVTAQRGELLALRDVSFEAGRGEFISIVGPSGSASPPCFTSLPACWRRAAARSPSTASRIDGPSPDRGVVLQNFIILPWRRVADNVVYGPRCAASPRRNVAASRASIWHRSDSTTSPTTIRATPAA